MRRSEHELIALRRKTTPRLAGLRVASPCTESWAAMAGDERVRQCARCDQPVYDLSALTREEAEALLRERGGASASICVRFHQRSDGTILTSDCGPGRLRRRLEVAMISALAVIAAFAGWRQFGATVKVKVPATMGVIADLPPLDTPRAAATSAGAIDISSSTVRPSER